MSPRRAPTDASAHLPLSEATFHVLMALVDRERHGSAIMREVERRTEGAVTLGPGTLYGSLKRLALGGLVEESEERPDPDLDAATRRYYRLTPLGLSVVRAEARRLASAVRLAREKRLLPAAEGA